MKPILLCAALLTCSNVFMTLAWYGHLTRFKSSHWLLAALASWGLALFEYLLQVPANRIGNPRLPIPRLKITQEVLAL
ncbi:MAG: DMT family protein, partial [Planctomycetes bacterium]|nr:DMT family protein [Planctomycetota bacterium]